MEVPWNVINLERPPNITSQIELKHFDVKTFLADVNSIIKDMESQEILNQEAATLSRLIYRMKTKFRNDKGLKNMEKVNKSLLRYLNLGLVKEYKSIKDYVQVEGRLVTLPSRQMIEYVLIRTLGYGKLMERIQESSSHSAKYFKSRIHCGHAWTISIVAYAVLSRIWTLSTHFIKCCSVWYECIYHFLKHFEMIGTRWLSCGYTLPCDMKSWINPISMEEDVKSNIGCLDPMFKLLSASKDNNNDNNELIIIEEKTDVGKCEGDLCPATLDRRLNNEISHNKNYDSDDMGEIINRNDLVTKRMDEKEKKKIKGKSKGTSNYSRICKTDETHRFETETLGNKNDRDVHSKIRHLAKLVNSKNESVINITEIKSKIMEFLEKDSYSRLDKLQWNIMKNKCKDYSIKIDKIAENKKKVVLLKKLIWTVESCIK